MVQETVGEGSNGKPGAMFETKVVVDSEVRAPSIDWVTLTVHVFTCLFVFTGVCWVWFTRM